MRFLRSLFRQPGGVLDALFPARRQTLPDPVARARRREAQVAGVQAPGPKHAAQARSQRLHTRGGQS